MDGHHLFLDAARLGEHALGKIPVVVRVEDRGEADLPEVRGADHPVRVLTLTLEITNLDIRIILGSYINSDNFDIKYLTDLGHYPIVYVSKLY